MNELSLNQPSLQKTVTDKIYIIGCGAFAKELSEYIADNNNYYVNRHIEILGLFGDDRAYYDHYEFDSPYMGRADDFAFQQGDKVLLGFNDNALRAKNIDRLEHLEVELYSFIHHSCKVSPSAMLGKGNVMCPQVLICPKAKIGDYNLFNYCGVIGHDCVIGENNVFSPNTQVTGYCHIGDGNFLGTSITLNPKVTIGNHNKIQSMSLIRHSIGDGNIVYNHVECKANPYRHTHPQD